jgi:acyl-CoA reductase-like NAD-dependent aldehyde dehydrogenase
VNGREILIDGKRLEGEGEPFEIDEPSTGEVLAEVRAASAAQTARAVESAAAAWPSWRSTPQPERSSALHRAAEAVRDARDELADLATHETGRTRVRNLMYVDWAVDVLRMYAELARVHGGRTAPSNERGQITVVRRVPYGVVSAIVPWNYPILLLVHKLAPALATGNTVVAKGAAETTLTTLAFVALLAGELPPGVLNVLAGGGEVGEAMVTHRDTHLVAFTGSSTAGRRIAAACADRTVPLHLELSGKDPAVVFDDVDPALAAEGVVWAAYLNAGQVCTATERAYVHRDVFDPFVDAAVELTAGLRVGDPFDDATQVGPLRTAGQLARFEAHLDDARARGSRILAGGGVLDRPGHFVRPALVVDVPDGADLLREETFAPILPVVPFETDDEAFAAAAATEYGLGASFYTSDPARVRRAMDEPVVGNVWINDPVVDNLAAPLGGMRGTGNGRELGLEGLHAFTTTRHVHWNVALERKPWWFGGT